VVVAASPEVGGSDCGGRRERMRTMSARSKQEGNYVWRNDTVMRTNLIDSVFQHVKCGVTLQ